MRGSFEAPLSFNKKTNCFLIQLCYDEKGEFSPTLNSAENEWELYILVNNEWELFRSMNINVWFMVHPLFSTAYARGFSSLYLYSDFKDDIWIIVSHIAVPFDIGKAGRYDYFRFGFPFVWMQIKMTWKHHKHFFQSACPFIFNKKKNQTLTSSLGFQ